MYMVGVCVLLSSFVRQAEILMRAQFATTESIIIIIEHTTDNGELEFLPIHRLSLSRSALEKKPRI